MRLAEKKSSRRHAIRHLMLGINAHMRYDLCCVLLEGVLDDRNKRLRDFLSVNAVIAKATDSVQRSIEDRYGEGLAILDTLGLGIDELLTEERFTRWRGDSWTNALAILDGTKSLSDVEREVAWKARTLALIPI